MIDLEKMGLIRIVGVPRCEIPLRIRKSIVGLELPCLYRDDAHTTSCNPVTGKEVMKHSAYVVLQSQVMKIFAEKAPKVERFYRDLGYPDTDAKLPRFSFNTECAKEVRPVMSKEKFFEFLSQNPI